MNAGPTAAGYPSDLLALVEAYLEQLDFGVDSRAARLTEAMRYSLLAGGKRLRPAFCYWGWRGAGGDLALDDAALRAAASLEFLQACALIHDDVMDGSDTRRGLPAAHRRVTRRGKRQAKPLTTSLDLRNKSTRLEDGLLAYLRDRDPLPDLHRLIKCGET